MTGVQTAPQGSVQSFAGLASSVQHFFSFFCLRIICLPLYLFMCSGSVFYLNKFLCLKYLKSSTAKAEDLELLSSKKVKKYRC